MSDAEVIAGARYDTVLLYEYDTRSGGNGTTVDPLVFIRAFQYSYDERT